MIAFFIILIWYFVYVSSHMSSHANVYSVATLPKQANTNEFVTLTVPDTDSWDLSRNDTLMCRNPGTWQLTSQYQMVGFSATNSALDATIDGWFEKNGVTVKDSGASGYVSRQGASNVLTIAHAAKFEKGDKIRFGIRSNTLNKQMTDNVNAGILSHLGSNGVSEPSMIITLLKSG
jgi:hypothetical protein